MTVNQSLKPDSRLLATTRTILILAIDVLALFVRFYLRKASFLKYSALKTVWLSWKRLIFHTSLTSNFGSFSAFQTVELVFVAIPVRSWRYHRVVVRLWSSIVACDCAVALWILTELWPAKSYSCTAVSKRKTIPISAAFIPRNNSLLQQKISNYLTFFFSWYAPILSLYVYKFCWFFWAYLKSHLLQESTHLRLCLLLFL